MKSTAGREDMYFAVLGREGKRTTIDFPGAPGCQTFVEPGEDILVVAREALEGWLEAHMADGGLPPQGESPFEMAEGETRRVLRVPISPALSARLQLRRARREAGLSQAQLAGRLGVSRQYVSQVEAIDESVSLSTLERVAEALGFVMELKLQRPPSRPVNIGKTGAAERKRMNEKRRRA